MMDSMEYGREGEFSMEEYFCYSKNMDSAMVERFIWEVNKNFIIYKMNWLFESPVRCFKDDNLQNEKNNLIRIHSFINVVIFAIHKNCDVACKIFRLKGFEKDDIKEFVDIIKESEYLSSKSTKKIKNKIKKLLVE